MGNKDKCSYSVGMIFRIDNELYVLAMTESFKVALIGLSTGNRWVDPIRVKNAYCISPVEWALIIDDTYTRYDIEPVGRIENVIKRREKWKKPEQCL